jgi:hypothetical protein
MRLTKAVFCVCALAVFGAFTVNLVTPSTSAAEPVQAKVDFTKKPWPDMAPGATYTDLPKPMMLGEKDNGPWGNDDTWGVVKFTHEEHYSKYKISCQTCHHTNGAGDAAQKEDVKRCVSCHKESGNEKNPSSASGDEIDVKLGFHGSEDNTTNQAGCITCHKARKVEPTTCAACHTKK